MGRKKLPIETISNKRVQQITFSKRKNGLLKKAMEISILCECEVSLTIISNSKFPKVFRYCSSLEEEFERIKTKDFHLGGAFRNEDYERLFGQSESPHASKAFDRQSPKRSPPLHQPESDPQQFNDKHPPNSAAPKKLLSSPSRQQSKQPTPKNLRKNTRKGKANGQKENLLLVKPESPRQEEAMVTPTENIRPFEDRSNLFPEAFQSPPGTTAGEPRIPFQQQQQQQQHGVATITPPSSQKQSPIITDLFERNMVKVRPSSFDSSSSFVPSQQQKSSFLIPHQQQASSFPPISLRPPRSLHQPGFYHQPSPSPIVLPSIHVPLSPNFLNFQPLHLPQPLNHPSASTLPNGTASPPSLAQTAPKFRSDNSFFTDYIFSTRG